MTDDMKFSFGDDEYKLEEDNNVSLGHDDDLPSSSRLANNLIEKMSKFRRILVPVVLISVIVSVYQLLNWYSSKRTDGVLRQENVIDQKPITPNATNTTQGAQEQQLLNIVQPKSVVSSPDVQDANNDMPTQKKLEILAERTEQNTIQTMRAIDSLTQTQATLVGLNQNVQELSKTVQNLNSGIQKVVINKQKTKAVKKKKKDIPPSVIYRIKAIVPGMAWLESSKKETVAVRVGQELPGYGTIRLISPNDGIVITSFGYVIQYGVNDF